MFDPINFYDWQKTDIIIPNELFSNKSENNEEGTGILDIFDLYNFTVKEDEPLETEVAIDPEMLGKVFERMLEVKERKSKGAFYTPREIVHYMAQQSLLYYLESHLNKTVSYEKLNSDELEIFGNETKKGQLDLTIENKELIVPKEDLEKFIHYGEHIIDKDIAIEEGFYSANSNKYEVPESIRKNAGAIDKALEDIKICDPAVGSGAFPVGVMNEIVKLRNLLTPFVIARSETTKQSLNNRDSYHFKANAIQNSIYGVDIDPGAVEIAKLRLWLSMVVDESNINRIDPLPNLEYKIVRGNSLINMPEGTMRDVALENEIQELTKHYYTITDKEEKQKQKQIIDEKIKQLLKSASNWVGYEIDFDFKLYFHEVFYKNEGFDIVIGNPPYIQLQKALPSNEKLKYADLYKKQKFITFERTSDIYALFYEKGMEILKEGGKLSFITSNKWMRANYGKSLRKFFSKYNPLVLLDLGPGIFSTATVDTNILIVAKEKPEKHKLKALTLKQKNKIYNLKDKDFTTLTNLTEDSWIILSPQEQKIKQRIEQVGTPLKDWNINIYRGVLTGYNEAFIIDGKTKDELITKAPKSAEIIKPILRGRDIKRYKAEFADLWLINTHNGYVNSKGERIPPIDINDYPVIKEHLDQYWEKLKKRQDKGITPYNLRNCAYIEEFEKEKIVYQELTQGASFTISNIGNVFVANTAYILTGREIKYLLALLNSILIESSFKKFISVGIGEKGIRWLNQYMQILPIPQIPKQDQKPFETLVDYILFLKQQENDTQSFYFEQIIDGMVYELYFEEEIKKAGCEIIKHLGILPEITDDMPDSEKQKTIDKVFAKLYDKNHPVRKNLHFMDSVEEVKIIKESLKK